MFKDLMHEATKPPSQPLGVAIMVAITTALGVAAFLVLHEPIEASLLTLLSAALLGLGHFIAETRRHRRMYEDERALRREIQQESISPFITLAARMHTTNGAVTK